MPAIEQDPQYLQVIMTADAYRQLKQNVSPGDIVEAQAVNLDARVAEAAGVARAIHARQSRYDYDSPAVMQTGAMAEKPTLIHQLLMLIERVDKLEGIANEHIAHLQNHDRRLAEQAEALEAHNLDARLGRLL